MKTIIILMLLAGSVVALAPSAAACEVTDPTGTTETCVDHTTYGSGSCVEQTGMEAQRVRAATFAPGLGYADADVIVLCQASSAGNVHYGFAAGTVWVEPVGITIAPLVAVYNGPNGFQCVAGVQVDDQDGPVEEHAVACPELPA